MSCGFSAPLLTGLKLVGASGWVPTAGWDLPPLLVPHMAPGERVPPKKTRQLRFGGAQTLEIFHQNVVLPLSNL